MNTPERWKKQRIDNLVKIGHGKDQKEIIDLNGKYLIYGSGGVIGKTNAYIYDKPSVLIGRKGTIDRPLFVDEPFWTVDTMFYTKIKPEINPKWLFYYFQTINWKKYNEATSIPSLSASTIGSIFVITPPHHEQNKIAEILSTWDDAISTINKSIEFETRRKKAIVSKVYRGNLSDDPNNSSHFQRLKKYLVEVKKKNGTGDLSVLSVSNSKGFILQEEQFERVIASKDRSNYKVVEKDQFAYNPSRVNVGSIDLMVEYDKGILSPMYVVFKCLKGLESRYLYHFLKSDLFLQMIPKYTQGSVRDSLAFSGLTSMRMYIPLVQEQNSYINLLDSIDRKISLLNNEVEFLKKQKQGLMQQLLTGKIRVKVS